MQLTLSGEKLPFTPEIIPANRPILFYRGCSGICISIETKVIRNDNAWFEEALEAFELDEAYYRLRNILYDDRSTISKARLIATEAPKEKSSDILSDMEAYLFLEFHGPKKREIKPLAENCKRLI